MVMPGPVDGGNGVDSEGDVPSDEQTAELWRKMWEHSAAIHDLRQSQALIYQRMDEHSRMLQDVNVSVREARDEARKSSDHLQESLEALSGRVTPLDQSKQRRIGAVGLTKWLVGTAIIASSAAAGWYAAVDEAPAAQEEVSERGR